MDGYVRVSRRMGREGPGYISPKVQQEAIERWADYRKIKIAKWHIDEDQSGGTQNRPGLREAVQRIEEGKTEGIACWRLNRFARNVAGAIDDVQRIQELGGHLAFVEEDIDPTGPFGSFLLTVLLAVATLERDNLSSGWRKAKSKAIERGARIGPALPGYRKKEDGVLELGDDADFMRSVFRTAGRDGLPTAIDMLAEQYPDRTWTSTTARRLLGSKVYLGEVAYGGQVNTDAHEALVTRGEWEAAQVPANDKRRPSDDYPLSGIVLCAGCKRPMVGQKSSGIRQYRCKYGGDRKPNPCEAPAVVEAQRLEGEVRRRLERDFSELGLQSMRGEISQSVDIQALERALEEAEAELYAFGMDLTAKRAFGDSYHAMIEERVEARDEAKEALVQAHQGAMTLDMRYPAEALENPDVLRSAARARHIPFEVARGREPIERRVRDVHTPSQVRSASTTRSQ